MQPNFHYHALNYLNQWLTYDKRYTEALSPNKSGQIVETTTELVNAAIYYKVIRNFKRAGDEDQGRRLQAVWDALHVTKQPHTHEDAIACVKSLRDALKLVYKNDPLSASSKFLWLRYQHPVIIYDSRARKALKVKNRDYGPYCEAWTNLYSNHKEAIKKACEDLIGIKRFITAEEIDREHFPPVSETWFHERVFDNYLWYIGD